MFIVLFIIVIIILGTIFKTVPSNTVIIIDRNSHYLKTKRNGIYFFWPSTDRVTTKISTNSIQKFYIEDFKTEDEKMVRISFYVKYYTDDVDSVLKALKDAKTSIDNIIITSVYNVIKQMSFKVACSGAKILTNDITNLLISEAQKYNIKVSHFSITNFEKCD